jgi:hypothetical protein
MPTCICGHRENMGKKKLIYIMGCGRSGSTILGFILNNGNSCLDLGEVIDFLKRKGSLMDLMLKLRSEHFGIQ